MTDAVRRRSRVFRSPVNVVGPAGTTLLAFLALPALLRAETPESPFVAGFDRFARHGVIEPAVGGRLLVTELSCTACHQTQSAGLQPKRGPRLDGAGNRLRRDWLRRFLGDPQQAKPGATMPHVLAGVSEGERKRTIDALAAFLSTRREPFPTFKAGGANPLPHEFWNKGRVDAGRDLYHRIGCVACHAPDPEFDGGEAKPTELDRLLAQLEPEEIAEMGLTAAARPVNSVPHGDLAAKYTHESLTFFLADPERTRPAGRMPNLKLSPTEAADLAAYLLRDQPQHTAIEARATDDELVAEGRRLFVDLSCANCHSLDGVEAKQTGKPLAALDPQATTTCFGQPVRGLPHFPLDATQTDAVRRALRRTSRETERSPVQLVEDRMLRLNCYACHTRGQWGGVGRRRQRYFEVVGHADLGDEGRLPPPLDHVGRKLTTDWLRKVFAGDGDLRPYASARMPVFPKAAVAPLPKALAAADGVTGATERDVFGSTKGLVEPGRQLLDTGCVQCHPLRGESLPGTLGIDLAGVTRRVRPAWFREFLRNPIDLKPRTRMPTFFPNGRSANPKVLDGDVDRQIAAMWAYLKAAERRPLPDKLAEARSKSFELKPEERPIVQRSFVQGAGTHAVAVGFPEDVHFAFDAETVRLAVAWRGRFLDAYGTWFSRFAPPAEPLGTDRMSFPTGPSFAVLESPDAPWPSKSKQQTGIRFSGYRLDEAGAPTFLYGVHGFDVEDTIQPAGEGGLRRRLVLRRRAKSPGEERVWFRALAGKELAQEGRTCSAAGGLSVELGDESGKPVLQKFDGGAEWRVPVEPGQTLEVEYRW